MLAISMHITFRFGEERWLTLTTVSNNNISEISARAVSKATRRDRKKKKEKEGKNRDEKKRERERRGNARGANSNAEIIFFGAPGGNVVCCLLRSRIVENRD